MTRADRGALLAGLVVSTQGGKVLLADGVRGLATLTLAEAGLSRNSILNVSGKLLGGMLAAQMALQVLFLAWSFLHGMSLLYQCEGGARVGPKVPRVHDNCPHQYARQ